MLSSRPTADLSTALQGLVAGMQATKKEDGHIDFFNSWFKFIIC